MPTASPTFADFDLPEAIRHALAKMDYVTPTPIQQKAIPVVLAGSDLIACAQTGTGKTAAFAIPLLARMVAEASSKAATPTRALIVAPTRELAEQIVEVLKKLTIRAQDHRIAFVIGGSTYDPQVRALQNKPSFVVGTPGRLIDHVEKGNLVLEEFTTIVIDEADRLLDMGFGPQLDQLFSRLPARHQTLMFSATIATEIRKLSAKYLTDPQTITIGERSGPREKIRQTLVRVDLEEKTKRLLIEVKQLKGSMIVFTNTIGRTEKIANLLKKAGYSVARIHGERSQNQRGQALQDLKDDEVQILVATDIAARGLDVPQLQTVINFDLPISPEDYIHRIGRTGRAGHPGHTLTFLMPSDDAQWKIINKIMKLMPHLAAAPRESPLNSDAKKSSQGKKSTKVRKPEAKGSVQVRSNKTKDQKFGVKQSSPPKAKKSGTKTRVQTKKKK